MKLSIRTTVLSLLITAGSIVYSQAQDAAKILQRMDDVMYAPEDLSATNTIILVDNKGREETRKAIVKQKGTDKRITRFTSPASQAGISVLGLPDDVMYLYLPAFGRERRISASVKNQNFAGTDFSYDDMEPKPYSDKYKPELIEEKEDIYALKLIPLGRSDYSKIIAHINKEHYYPEYMEYYDKGNNKIKEAHYTFKKVGEFWNSTEIVMKDLKKDHKTIMKMSDVEYNTGLSDEEFTVRKLKQ